MGRIKDKPRMMRCNSADTCTYGNADKPPSLFITKKAGCMNAVPHKENLHCGGGGCIFAEDYNHRKCIEVKNEK